MLRSKDASRLEGFSDAVFGFALTLLVVSLEVPSSFAALRETLKGFPAFAITFTIVCWIWVEHYVFFRKFALRDGLTVFLNSVLLFTVMFFVYPLKFTFTLVVGGLLGLGPRIDAQMTADDARLLMLVYSAGFVAVFSVFALLHLNAWRQRLALQLSRVETFDAAAGVRTHLFNISVGLISIALAALLPPERVAISGLIFFVLGPGHFILGHRRGRARARLESAP